MQMHWRQNQQSKLHTVNIILDSKCQSEYVDSNLKKKPAKIETNVFLVHIIWTRFYAGGLILITSFNSPKNSIKFYSFIFRWKQWDSEKLRVRSKIMKLETYQNLNPGCLIIELIHITSILYCLQGTPSSVGYLEINLEIDWQGQTLCIVDSLSV